MRRFFCWLFGHKWETVNPNSRKGLENCYRCCFRCGEEIYWLMPLPGHPLPEDSAYRRWQRGELTK